MAGGTWVTQNKERPGVYINTVSDGGSIGSAGDRGVMAMALVLSWGPSKEIVTINAGDDVKLVLGYDITAPEMLLIREALKRAKALLVYRLNSGVKATKTIGALTATAKYGGVRGNDLSVVVQTNIEDSAKFDVITRLGSDKVDTQVGATVADLKSNAWVTWTGTGPLTTSAGAALTGGTNGTAVNSDHTDFLAALELQDFQTVALPSTDNMLKAVYAAFTRRLRDGEGKKIQVVVESYPLADYEGVISVKNGVVLSDGTILTAAQATAWVAAATAAATIAESLTFKAYDDAMDASPRYTNSQTIAALHAGELLFTAASGKALVEQDINTLTSFTVDKGKQFRKNRIVRVVDGISNDLKRIFESFYLGKINNDSDGRNLLKSEMITYLNTLQEVKAIQNFDSKADINVLAGDDSDSVYVELDVQPVDSIEKIYMKVKVN